MGPIAAGLKGKAAALEVILSEMVSLVVAFSGGVDSTYLLKAAVDVLGDRVTAVTATSPTYPQRELEEARGLAAAIGCRHLVIESNELEIPGFSENTPRRCYFCKSELFTLMREKASELGMDHVADGSNCDDLEDFRPGREAARELEIRSPLVEAGLGKEEIRQLSREAGLPTWNKPSFACLSSRFPYGTDITAERVSRVGRCEEILRGLSLSQYRVRYHGDVARIEVGEKDFEKFFSLEVRRLIVDGFKGEGFRYVSLDMEGYRTGSMNEVLR